MERSIHGRCEQCEPYWGHGGREEIAEWVGQVIGLVLRQSSDLKKEILKSQGLETGRLSGLQMSSTCQWVIVFQMLRDASYPLFAP